MSDRRIRNISSLTSSLKIQVKNHSKDGYATIELNPNEEFWTSSHEDTNAIIIYTRRGFLSVEEHPKPIDAEYSTTYEVGRWDIELEMPPIPQIKAPKRTEKAIEVERDTEAVGRLKWSDKEISYLKKHYPKKGVIFCAEKLDRPNHSVKRKVESLGLKKLKK